MGISEWRLVKAKVRFVKRSLAENPGLSSHFSIIPQGSTLYVYFRFSLRFYGTPGKSFSQWEN